MKAVRPKPAAIRKSHPSKRNMGGPLEKAALKDMDKFTVWVRDNRAGGYIYMNPYRSEDRRAGHAVDDDDEPIDPSTFQVDLYQFDLNAHKLHPQDEKLVAILYERECIRECRRKQENSPVESGAKLVAYREKDKTSPIAELYKRWKRDQDREARGKDEDDDDVKPKKKK